MKFAVHCPRCQKTVEVGLRGRCTCGALVRSPWRRFEFPRNHGKFVGKCFDEIPFLILDQYVIFLLEREARGEPMSWKSTHFLEDAKEFYCYANKPFPETKGGPRNGHEQEA